MALPEEHQALNCDAKALLANDYHALMATLNKVLAVPEHAEFLSRLEKYHSGKR